MSVLMRLSLALRPRTSQKLFANKPSTVCGTLFAATLLLVTSAWGQGKVLYSFNQPPDGIYPAAGLVRDGAGNFYGATPGGGDFGPQQCQAQPAGCGVVYELTNSGGTWIESIIHTFVPGTTLCVAEGGLSDFDSTPTISGRRFA